MSREGRENLKKNAMMVSLHQQ